MMISASSRAFVLSGETTTWRTRISNAIIAVQLMIASLRPVDGVFGIDSRSRDDFTVHYEEREVQLSHLTGLDFYVAYWREGWVGHTFLSFVFDNAPPVSISIETRPEVGEGFAPIASLFKQFELIYVVGRGAGHRRIADEPPRRIGVPLPPEHFSRRCAPSVHDLPRRGSTSSPIGRNSIIC